MEESRLILLLLFLAALSYIASMLLFWKFSFLKYVVLASTVVWIGECLEAFGRINIFSGLGNIFLLPKSFWNNYCNLWFTCVISEAWINFIFILANHFAMLKIAWIQKLFKAVALCCAQLHSCNCKFSCWDIMGIILFDLCPDCLLEIDLIFVWVIYKSWVFSSKKCHLSRFLTSKALALL